jgi:septal ring factor EnvC (AmiA/AmiB activator)
MMFFGKCLNDLNSGKFLMKTLIMLLLIIMTFFSVHPVVGYSQSEAEMLYAQTARDYEVKINFRKQMRDQRRDEIIFNQIPELGKAIKGLEKLLHYKFQEIETSVIEIRHELENQSHLIGKLYDRINQLQTQFTNQRNTIKTQLQNQATKLQEQLTIQNNAVSAQLKTHETQLVGNINSLKSTIKGEVENDLLEILSVIQKQNENNWTKTIALFVDRIQTLQNQLNEKDAELAKLKKQDACTKPLR